MLKLKTMELSTTEKIKLLKTGLDNVDIFSAEFSSQIQNIADQHKTNGGHIEYAYVQHFHKEIVGLSKLFHYLLEDNENQKYTFFAVRGSIEILLYLEYVLRLAKEDRDENTNKVLSLLSRDMAQIGAAIDSAAPTDKEHDMHKTLKAIHVVNRILDTDFDLEKVKANTRVFPSVRDLCNQSSLNIKDLHEKDIYHIYALYSESNHLRLGSQHAITDDIEILTCWALEYFLEIYIKFYQQLLDTNIFAEEYTNKFNSLKQTVGLSW